MAVVANLHDGAHMPALKALSLGSNKLHDKQGFQEHVTALSRVRDLRVFWS